MQHVQLEARENALREMGVQGENVSPDQQVQVEALAASFVAQGMQNLQALSRQLSGQGQKDPVVDLKQQELQLEALKEQNDVQAEQAELSLKQAQQMDKSRQFDERLASQEQIAREKINAARERAMIQRRNNNVRG